MAREPRPWRWKARKGWYATVGGVRHRLAALEDGKRNATLKLAELMRAGGGRPGDIPSVTEVVYSYLESLGRRRDAGELAPSSRRDAARRLSHFAAAFGDRRADSIRPDEVLEWLGTRETWGPTFRHDVVGAIRAVYRWAVRGGRLDRDPLAALDKPRRRPKREAIPGPEAIERAIASAGSPDLADLLAFLFETGCRPGEARALEAKHLSPAEGVAVLAEHKTARKTGRRRVIYLTPRAMEITSRLASRHPEGPIFRNSRDRPWTVGALGEAVRRLRAKAGLGPELVAYAMRHAFATYALGKVGPALVAELMGHANLQMLAKYSHLSDRHDALRDAAAKVRGPGRDVPEG